MTDHIADERTPLESYTFTYTEQEMKSLRNELDKSSVVRLIVLSAIIIVLFIYSIILNSESQMFGFSLATLLYIGSGWIIRFRQRKYLAEYSDKRVAQNEYLYEFFDDCLRLTVHRNGKFISCTYVELSDIQKFWITKEFYAFTAGNFLYMVRKSALPENSRVPQLVCRSNMQKPSAMSEQGAERVIPEDAKKLDMAALVLFIVSIILPFISIILTAFVSYYFNLAQAVLSAVFFLCAGVAVASVVLAFVLRAKGVLRVRNFVSGVIIAVICIGFGVLFLM